MVNIMYILPQLLKIVLWKQVSAIPPQIESFHSDYWFVMKIAKCVIFIHIRLHASLVLCFRYVKISYELHVICFSRYCTRVLEWLTLEKKKKDFLLSLLCHAVYFAYSNTLLCGREKNVWIYRSKWRVAPNLESSNEVCWNWATESRETSVCRKTYLKHSEILVRQFFCFCFCFRDYLKIICYLGACEK